MNERNLILVRGISGSGKTTLAETLAASSGGTVNSADNWFVNDKGEYKWEGRLLPWVHQKCLDKTEEDMIMGVSHIFVANTFAPERELRPYFEIAEKHNYKVFSIVVENRHGNENVHDVPEASLTKQRNRFKVQL